MEDDGPPGVPEWVVTYGDMMSLLLTFFIMLVSLSEVVADQKYRAILESLNQKFGYRHGPTAPPGKSFPLNAMLENLATLGSFTNEDQGHGGVREESVPGKDFRSFRNREGDGIPVGEPIAFEPGTANPVGDPERILAEIARQLAGFPNKVEIRGIRPLVPDDPDPAARTRTCYERARYVQRYLESHRVAPERLRLVVAGDNAAGGGDDGRIRTSDRVEVYVLDTHVHEFVGGDD